MALSKKLFISDLYQEHLQECTNLFLDRETYFDDNDIGWLELQDLEKRLVAHYDAVLVGFKYASRVCYESIEMEDEDLLTGAIFCLLSLENSDKGLLFLSSVYADLIEKFAPSFLVGFKYGKTTDLNKFLIKQLASEIPILRAISAEALGYRGDVDPKRIWPLFHDNDESVKLAAMVAVMRLGYTKAVPAMEQAVLESKEIFNEHSIFPLLMLGSKKALHFSRLACQSAAYIKPQYPVYIALAGGEEDIDQILKALKFSDMNLAVLEALGIFGSLEGVKTLMKFLSSEEDEEKLAAANSLNQISGAQLYESLTIVEKDDDDINAHDITGKPPSSGEAVQAGDERTIEIKQSCTDKQRWLDWWQDNKSRFDTSIRYRNGKPYSFLLLLEEIAHPETNYENRQRAYNELVMRSGHHIPFEPDWFVDKQIEALKKWQAWWNENKASLTNQWMFGGK